MLMGQFYKKKMRIKEAIKTFITLTLTDILFISREEDGVNHTDVVVRHGCFNDLGLHEQYEVIHTLQPTKLL